MVADSRFDNPAQSRWIRRFGPAPDAPHRLVCFPYAGGSASYFFRWMQALAPDIDVVAVQYPGRQERRTEPVIDDIDRLAEHIAAEVLPWIDRPTAFFGHSMGAILAFEVALRLERAGTRITELFVSGRRGPATSRDERTYLAGDAELLADVVRLGATDASALADPEIAAMVLPPIRGDYRAIERYRWAGGPQLHCGITALAGDADPKTTVDEVAEWRSHTRGGFGLRQYPGGHFFLNQHADAVHAVIRQRVIGAAMPAK
ncbi:thioesterase II family protein [Nocardia sp. CA-119907]|uniref:thioesterase II family protein n=1 Tax=Nocardia sp. CA-119907 TaxID=3239973 RepID=UPI003D996C1A